MKIVLETGYHDTSFRRIEMKKIGNWISKWPKSVEKREEWGFSSPPWPISGYDSDRASQNVQFFYENQSEGSIFRKNTFFNTFSTVF